MNTSEVWLVSILAVTFSILIICAGYLDSKKQKEPVIYINTRVSGILVTTKWQDKQNRYLVLVTQDSPTTGSK